MNLCSGEPDILSTHRSILEGMDPTELPAVSDDNGVVDEKETKISSLEVASTMERCHDVNKSVLFVLPMS